MKRLREDNKEGFLSILVGIIILLVGGAIVFYAAYKVSYVSVDYGTHVGIARDLDWSDPVQMLKEHPEPAWHLLVKTVMMIGGISAERAAGFVSGGLCALTYWLAAIFLYCRAGSGRRGEIPGAAGAGRSSLPKAAFYALILNLVCALYMPWFNKKPYLGQGSPNPWHNPTTLMVRPIGLLIFILVIEECLRVQRSGFRKGQGLRIWKGILITILLLLSNLSKPSFVQVFYPGIFLLMFLWLFVYRFRNFPLGMQLLVCCLPSVALMGMQFISAFYGNTNSESAGVVIAPFKVAGMYTHNIAISTLLVLAFPLLTTFISIIRRTFDWTAAFAWIMLLVGMAEKFLLAEGGSRMAHGNFNWGYTLALYFVWFIAVRDFANWAGTMRLEAPGVKKVLLTLFFWLDGILLLYHLLSGIYYLYYLIVLGNSI